MVGEDDQELVPMPDTPALACEMVMNEATEWLEAAQEDGLQISDSAYGNIEVSFLLSYEGENLSWLKHVHKRAKLGGKIGYIDHEG